MYQKTFLITLLLILSACSANLATGPESDRFVGAITEIGCLGKKEPPSDSKTMTAELETIAKKYGFAGRQELDTMATKYRNSGAVIQQVKDKLNTQCP